MTGANCSYRMRPIVLDETGKELKHSNWKSILDTYEEKKGEIDLMYREPRGSAHPSAPRRDFRTPAFALMVEEYEPRPVSGPSTSWSTSKEGEGAQGSPQTGRLA